MTTDETRPHEDPPTPAAGAADGPSADAAQVASSEQVETPGSEPPPIPKRAPNKGRADRMANIAVRALAFGYLAMGGIALALFFVPWVRVWEPHPVGYSSQSGWQLASGKYLVAGGDVKPEEGNKFDVHLEAMLPLWCFPAGMVLVVVFGLGHLVLARSYRPLFPFLGAAVSATVLIVCLATKFPVEKITPRHSARDYVLLRLGGLERTGSFYLAVVLTFGVLAFAIAHYVLAGLRQRWARQRTPEAE